MGSRRHNFYNDAFRRAGYVDAAAEVQRLWLDGRRDEATARVPDELVLKTNLLGTEAMVRARLAAYRAAGITTLRVEPAGHDPRRAPRHPRPPHRARARGGKEPARARGRTKSLRKVAVLVMLVTVSMVDHAAARTAEEGVASFYSDQFEGKRTASGEIYRMNGLTAAHKKLPYGTKVKVSNVENGKSVVVTINDRMPASSRGGDRCLAACGRATRIREGGESQGHARSPEVAGGDSLGESHLGARGATERRIGIGELHHDGEVIVARLVQHLDGHPLGSPGRGERLHLPVILRALEATHREQQRARMRGSEVNGAVAPRGLGRELQRVVEIAEADGLQIVKPAESARPP